jgi:hypothetical protein
MLEWPAARHEKTCPAIFFFTHLVYACFLPAFFWTTAFGKQHEKKLGGNLKNGEKKENDIGE